MKYLIVIFLIILFISVYAGIMISVEEYIDKREENDIETGKKADKRAEDYCV